MTFVTLRGTTLINIIVLLQEALQCFIRVDIIFVQAKNTESLHFGYKSSFNSKPFLSNLLSALVSEFLAHSVLSLLNDELEHLLLSLLQGEWTNHHFRLFLDVFFVIL